MVRGRVGTKGYKDRVKRNVRRFKGEEWFEFFRERFKEKGCLKEVNTWHAIRLRDVSRLLGVDNYCGEDSSRDVSQLVRQQLILPARYKGFDEGEWDGLVHLESLGELVAGFTGEDFEDSFLRADDYFKGLVGCFLNNQLGPFVRRNKISYEESFSVMDASRKVGIPEDEIKMAIDKCLLKKSKTGMVQGVDIAVYYLRGIGKNRFTSPEIACLLGADKIDVERFGFPMGVNGSGYSSSLVLPIYDKIANSSRRIVLGKNPEECMNLTPMKVEGKNYYITSGGQRAYCETQNLTGFDEGCKKHVIQNLEMIPFDERKDKKIKTPQMIFTMRAGGRIITSVRLNNDDAVKPLKSYMDSDRLREYFA